MAKTKELIKAAAIMRVSDKSGKFLGFGVKSNHSEQYYQIRCTRNENGVVYVCNCEARQWGKECSHIKAIREMVAARRQMELDGAAAVAPLVVGQAFADDLPAHLDDAMPVQQPEPDPLAGQRRAIDRVYAALTLGTVNDLAEVARKVNQMDHIVVSLLNTLIINKRVVAKEVAEGKYWIDAPDQAYRTAYYSDFAA